MKVTLHKHTGLDADHQEVFEGTPEQIEIYFRRKFDLLNREIIPGDLMGCLHRIDSMLLYSVEINSGEEELQKYEPPLKKYIDELYKNELSGNSGEFDNELLTKTEELPPTPAPEPVVAKSEADQARSMQGISSNIESYFNAASWLAPDCDVLAPTEARKALLKADGDLEYAALKAYGLEVDERNVSALRGLVSSTSLSKGNLEPIAPPKSITAAHPDGTTAEQEVARAFKAGAFHLVKLGGKHSAGSMVGRDPESKHLYLLKPGSGKNSPAAGVNEESASQSRREAAFWAVMEMWGLGEYGPRVDLLFIDGREVAALRMLPLSFENLGDALKKDYTIVPKCFKSYLMSGILHKWAILYWILGEPDAHQQNIMVDEDGRTIRLIDHGSAMAGESFDPAGDDKSFIPYFLRAWVGRRFDGMSQSDQLHHMPTAGIDGEKILKKWVRDLDPKALAHKLSSYGIDPEPMVARLGQAQMLEGPKDVGINKLWIGLG